MPRRGSRTWRCWRSTGSGSRAGPSRSTIYTLLGAARDAAFEQLAETQGRFLAAYRRQDWSAAKTLLADCVMAAPSLGALAALFAARIAEYETQPANPDWDGVYTATSKTG